MLIFKNSVCKVKIDVEKTREYYKQHKNDFCDCLYCRNYLKALPLYSIDLLNLLESMGIDFTKEGEAMHLNINEDDTHSYLVFYHVVGEIIEGDNVWRDLEYATDFRVSSKCDLLPSDFPKPAVQINIAFNLNWVVNEKP